MQVAHLLFLRGVRGVQAVSTNDVKVENKCPEIKPVGQCPFGYDKPENEAPKENEEEGVHYHGVLLSHACVPRSTRAREVPIQLSMFFPLPRAVPGTGQGPQRPDAAE